ncbi:uncharacterized protein FOMMEDRAFT_112550 [Fomitiporia mediterranea MF3/22]|uniref:uncharacterized protein n=1 Tax=Fomitiporia mediterranea (strain MF3/22) TaxID=694068 RepID=UPI000440744E|nr:uncharacterized protein FOMMEDRAFT_112550 [Fomitiporia mediterranea MF3/22]EJD00199.1 hypothetical protein FOMMEDRAFT_112550 [Fomitiporia mediterranea MF3/22]
MSDSPDIVFERSYYIGIVFHAMLYGMDIYMYFQSLYLLLNSRRNEFYQSSRIYVIVGGIMLFLYTFAFAADAVYGQLMWIEHRDFPGGPVAYFVANSSIWIQTLGTLSGQISMWMGDGLLLYRCWIVWNTWKVTIFPFLIYLFSIIFGLITLVESALPGANFFRGNPVNFGVPWVALSVALNIVATTLICTRIMIARRQLNKAQNTNDRMPEYTGAMAILVESSLPVSLLGIVFAVTFGKNLDISLAFTQIWGVSVVLSPQFIILRVAMGRAWTRKVASQFSSSIRFTGISTTRVSDGVHTFDSREKGSTALAGGKSAPSLVDSQTKSEV